MPRELMQAGAVPFRQTADGPEFLLVTSEKGRWIFPKGIVEPGDGVEETAEKECEEEAGVRGELFPESLGQYTDHKWLRECVVVMFLLHYKEEVHPWEEQSIREREWCSYQEASLRIVKPELQTLLDEAYRRLQEGI